LDLHLSTVFRQWDDTAYRSICFGKLDVLKYVSAKYSNYEYILYLDTDIYINIDPLPYLMNIINSNKETDIFIQSDNDYNHFIMQRECDVFCAGFLFLKIYSTIPYISNKYMVIQIYSALVVIKNILISICL
jgi:hypothetical protein